MASSISKLRVFFIPFYATGHMIPLLDLAFLFAGRSDVEPTLVTTAANAALLGPTIDHFKSVAGHVIEVLLYPFPSAEAGLLPGQENISSIPYADIYKMCSAGDLSMHPIKRLLRLHRPDAVVADVAFWWMTDIARELKVPNIVFHAIGVFPQLLMDALHRSGSYVHVAEQQDRDTSVTADVIPGREIQLPRSELPWFLRMRTHLTEAWVKMKAAQMESFGAVVNTFYDMESDYCDEYRRMAGRKAWFVGPVGLAAAAMGGRRAGGENNSSSRCLRWLDGKGEGSVVFVCFGSWCNFSEEQLKEIALGLEKSGVDFLWVVRGCKDGQATGEGWVPLGWEERVEGKGMLVRGWGPQTAILEHKAVGAFMTHCGWNSMMEAAATGVPMLTWPLVFEQFMSERLAADVLGTGARVWAGFRSTRDEEREVVPNQVICEVVSRSIKGTDGLVKERARKLAEMAAAAITDGGSSRTDLHRLIDDLMEVHKLKTGDSSRECNRC